MGQLRLGIVVTAFINIVQAFQAARARASVAQSIEAQLLHRAIAGAREQGMSTREAAAALRVPKSTVARHWRENHHCLPVPPVWGNAAEYEDAQRAAWSHAPEELDDWVPYEWEDTEDDARITRLRSRGVATLGTEDGHQ